MKLAQLAATALFLMLSPHAIAQSSSDPRPYAKLSAGETMALSPDGRTLAIVQTASDNSRTIAIFPMDGSPQTSISAGKEKVRSIHWATNDRLLISITRTDNYGFSDYRFEFGRVLSVGKDGKNPAVMMSDRRYVLNTSAPQYLHRLPNDPEHVLMAHYDPFEGGARGGSRLATGRSVGTIWPLNVYRVEVATGREKLVEKGNGDTSYWIADADGELRVRVDYVDKLNRREFWCRPKGEKKFTKVAEFEEEDGEAAALALMSFDPTGTFIVAIEVDDDGRSHLVKFDPRTGDITGNYWSNPQYDVASAQLHPKTGVAIGAGYTGDIWTEEFIEPSYAAIHQKLKKAFGKDGASVTIESRSDELESVIVGVRKPGTPADFYFFDNATNEASYLINAYPTIAKENLAAVSRYDFTSSDGLQIPGYLHRPKGTSGAMPLVVLPHGGPHARDSMGFDWMAQYFASLGYAVYQPNFRGSTGYGVDFRDAGKTQWGLKMQDDITEGVRSLIADDIADPSKICIVGGSYGGYAALVGGGKTPDLYKCVVSYAGVTDIPQLFSFVRKQTGKYSESVQFWLRSIGDIDRNQDALKAVSPTNMTENFNAPVLLIHGKDDLVVPIDQSKRMKNALERAGKEVEYIELKGEDHWLSSESTRLEMLQASGAFLQKHLD